MANDYLAFFNLQQDPFRMPPDPFYFYPAERHNEILSSLNFAIEQKEGFFLATGEPGTGKTTILKVFIEHWNDRAEIALIMTPRLNPEEFLAAVLDDLKVPLSGNNKHDMIKEFRSFLLRTTAADRRVILIVDEAQNLPDETLEELRLLSNLETEKEKLIQIVLLGQPEFRERIMHSSLRQLNQRISVRSSLAPLSYQEMVDYIQYRLMKTGTAAILFDEAAKKSIYAYSGGIPRLINLSASRAMMAAFVDGSRQVRGKHADQAILHLQDAPHPAAKRFSRGAIAAVAAGVMMAGLVGIAGFRLNLSGHPGGAPSSPATAQTASQPAVETASTGSPQTLVIAAGKANLRVEPAMDARIAARADQGERFVITGWKDGDDDHAWYRISHSDGRELWVRADKVIKILDRKQP